MFENHNANFILIPPGLTSILQPLDTHVNKISKNNVRNEYHRWLLNNKSDNITDSIVLDFIYNAWYNINKIKQKELIKQSFRDNGITLATDGSEDKEFLKIPIEYLEAMKIENDFPPELQIKNEIENDNAEDEEDNVPLYI